jgi:RNA-directed DNA polymerase
MAREVSNGGSSPQRADWVSERFRKVGRAATGEGPNDVESQGNMPLKKAMRQMTRQRELTFFDTGEARSAGRSGEADLAMQADGDSGTADLMERVVESSNINAAVKRVKQNRGSPGIDGMTAEELPAYLATHWQRLREELLAGTYQPMPVREVEIPKEAGVRKLGVPTVIDRFLQQSILQVLQPILDPAFSEHSYGFRPGRSAHQAVRAAQQYIQAGKQIVVDCDLDSFFDRVNHDVLMGRLALRIEDKRLLRLIRRYLNAGIMANGVVMERRQGTPQGSPLSPLMANVLLEEVDKELEKRGLAFVRYADDLNVYVRSWRAGHRTKETLMRLYGKLKLRINEKKSAVDRPWKRKLLGYTFWVARGGDVKRVVASKALMKMKERVRAITGRNRGRSMTSVFAELSGYLTGWKRGRTIYREMKRLGASESAARKVAGNARCWWKNSAKLLNTVLTISYFDQHGIPRLAA